METQKKSKLSPIKKDIDKILSEISDRSFGIRERIEKIWRRTVGEEFSKLAYIKKVSSKKIQIEVLSSSALAELKQFYSDQFLANLEKEKIFGIEKISFNIGDE